MTKPKHKQIKINIPTKILFSSYVLGNYHISIVQPIGHLQSKVCSQSQLHHIHEPRQISPANFLVVEKKTVLQHIKPSHNLFSLSDSHRGGENYGIFGSHILAQGIINKNYTASRREKGKS